MGSKTISFNMDYADLNKAISPVRVLLYCGMSGPPFIGRAACAQTWKTLSGQGVPTVDRL
jgi:hypothetical protein